MRRQQGTLNRESRRRVSVGLVGTVFWRNLSWQFSFALSDILTFALYQ